MEYRDKFKDFTRARGLKDTPERESILDAVFSIHHHFDIEDVFQLLKSQGRNISRSTIYRMIPLLLESGMIKEVLHCMGNTRYEHVFGHRHHDHLICIGCGRIIEFYENTIEEIQEKLCREYGFLPVEHHLGIKGYCSECRKKK